MSFKKLFYAAQAALLCMLPMIANAALPTSGDWFPAYTVSGTEEVTLTGDVVFGDKITIPEGCSLTINAAGHRIKARDYNENVLAGNYGVVPVSFEVYGELIIRGTEGNPVDVWGKCKVDYGYDGLGNDPSFEYANTNNIYSNYMYEPEKPENYGKAPDGTDPHMSNFIRVMGNNAHLQMEYVNIHNLRSVYHFNAATVLDIGTDGDVTVNVVLKHVNIYQCMSSCNKGMITVRKNTKGNVNLSNCHIHNCRTYNYGGILTGIGGGNTSAVVTLDNCEINNCISSGWGGAILWACNPTNGAKLVLKGCNFHHNYARCLGGAISNEGKVELENCMIKNNFAGYGGGGIASFPFSVSTGGSTEANGLVLKTGNLIQNNTTLYSTNVGKAGRFGAFDSSKEYPSGGGGIWILMNKDGWTCEATFGADNTISENTSAYSGGGILMYKSLGGTTSLTSVAIIKGNKALSGGGIAIGADAAVTELPSMTITGGQIIKNTATAGNGGGVYMPGGIFKMTDGMISQNTASANGGGFSIKHGTVTVSGNSEISYNNCGNYGAGLYVTNSESDRVSTTFDGGIIKQNGHTNCVAGGGICVDGNIDFTTTASIEDNQALNGGGICVINGANMTYKSGLIRNNKAEASIVSYTTGYQKGVTEIQGFGGGVFVADNGSKLTFSMSAGTSLGLYGNLATNGADDLFANGNGTTIVIPNVNNMALTDFKVPVPSDALFWAEDYTTNDPNYGYGTKIDLSWVNENSRYRNALNNLLPVQKVVLADSEVTRTLTCYTSLALGYHLLLATIEKSGMKIGDSALIDLIRVGDTTPYCTVLLKGVDEAGTTVSQQIALYPGKWKAVESPWSWTYTATKAEITQTIVEGGENKFVFENTSSSTTVPHGENSVTNELK